MGGVWESTSVPDERRPRTYEAPAHMPGYAVPEAAAACSRFAGCNAVSMPRSRVGNCSILLIFGKLPLAGANGGRFLIALCRVARDVRTGSLDPGLCNIAQQSIRAWINMNTQARDPGAAG